jgi:arabinose-5-phosphate isomerase
MILKRAKQVIKEELKALKQVADSLDENFERAVRLILETKGKLVVVGIGKSGLVGRKIAATLSSTGTPALFLHAAECLHGDIGVIEQDDIVMILSYSGTTDEIAMVLPAIKRLNVPVIAVTGNKNSELARSCAVVIEVAIEKEACPMNLAPTTSTTAMLVIGDALAIALLEERGFRSEDFANLHPAGALGKQLLLRVEDIISKSGANPVIKSGCTVRDALMAMTSSRVGATSIIDEKGNLIGYFTDGDLRRHLQEDTQILNRKIDEVMTVNPMTIKKGALVIEAREVLQKNNFDNIPVVDEDNKPFGVIDERDIIREGL